MDRFHPVKRDRPVARGAVSIRLAYAEWITLMVIGLALSYLISIPFLLSTFGLWLAGCTYNIRPLRTKDVPYLDVVSEAINNPLRMLAGWYLSGIDALPITSLLISYWMAGCYFMAVKRYAEVRELDLQELARYRPCFRRYTEQNLLVSIVFYVCLAMLFLGLFIARYRLELALSFPLVAWVMCAYLGLAFKRNSPAQHPEKLYRQPLLVIPAALCVIAMIALLFIDVPFLYSTFRMSRP